MHKLSVHNHFGNDHCVSMNILCDCKLLRYCVPYDNNAQYKICNKMYFLRFILFRNTQGTCNCRKFMKLYKVLYINPRLVLVREVQVDGGGLNADEMHLTCLLMTMYWHTLLVAKVSLFSQTWSCLYSPHEQRL